VDLELQIRQLAEQGFGRTKIIRAVPDASEYLVRRIIDEVKGTRRERPFKTVPETGSSRVNNFDVVSALRPIEIKLGKPQSVSKNLDELYTVAVFGDVQAPFHHNANVNVACKIIADQRKIRLDETVDLGDAYDFYAVSRFDKNPLRRNLLQDELIIAGEVRARFTDAAGDSKKTFIPGNHEARLKKYINQNAPALAGMPQLQLDSLLGLSSAGWEVKDRYHVIKEGFVIKHGDLVGGQSGDSAKKEMNTAWMSGASGHVHRLGVHYRSPLISHIKGEQPYVWIETGCLCLPDQEYLDGKYPDWQPGFVFLRFTEDGFVFPELVPVHEGRAYYRGKLYEAT
jgi:hypothetical protein